MKQNRSIFIGWQAVLVLVIILYGLLKPAYCQDFASAEWQPRTDAAVLLMQQPDSRAGAVTPGVGVHYFDLDAEVLLTAVPKPGYYFVYWIGDVSDPTAVSTIIYMDAPKIVVAVFARSEFEFLFEEMMMLGGGGGGGMRPSAADYSNQEYTGGGAKRYSSSRSPSPPPLPDEFPVPEDPEVPETPEPATALLLGLGCLLLVRRSPMDSLQRTKR
jgi:hypothetical protein